MWQDQHLGATAKLVSCYNSVTRRVNGALDVTTCCQTGGHATWAHVDGARWCTRTHLIVVNSDSGEIWRINVAEWPTTPEIKVSHLTCVPQSTAATASPSPTTTRTHAVMPHPGSAGRLHTLDPLSSCHSTLLTRGALLVGSRQQSGSPSAGVCTCSVCELPLSLHHERSCLHMLARARLACIRIRSSGIRNEKIESSITKDVVEGWCCS